MMDRYAIISFTDGKELGYKITNEEYKNICQQFKDNKEFIITSGGIYRIEDIKSIQLVDDELANMLLYHLKNNRS